MSLQFKRNNFRFWKLQNQRLSFYTSKPNQIIEHFCRAKTNTICFLFFSSSYLAMIVYKICKLYKMFVILFLKRKLYIF